MYEKERGDDFVVRLVAASLSNTIPSEPSFLKPYSADRHEALIGTLPLKLQHVYLLVITLTEELDRMPRSKRRLERYLLARQHFCREVCAYFNMDTLHDREFEICQGFVVYLKKYEVDDKPLSESDERLFQALEDVAEGRVVKVL